MTFIGKWMELEIMSTEIRRFRKLNTVYFLSYAESSFKCVCMRTCTRAHLCTGQQVKNQRRIRFKRGYKRGREYNGTRDMKAERDIWEEERDKQEAGGEQTRQSLLTYT